MTATVVVVTTHSDVIDEAIAKLETLRAAGAAGVWQAYRQYVPNFGVQYGIQAERPMVYGWDIEAVATLARAANAELIALLHRTIDPQLEILRTQVGAVQVDGFALKLARSILGSD